MGYSLEELAEKAAKSVEHDIANLGIDQGNVQPLNQELAIGASSGGKAPIAIPKSMPKKIAFAPVKKEQDQREQEVAKKVSALEIPSNISAETGAALERFKKLVNGTSSVNDAVKDVKASTALPKIGNGAAKPLSNGVSSTKTEDEKAPTSIKPLGNGSAKDLPKQGEPVVLVAREEATEPFDVQSSDVKAADSVDPKVDFFSLRRGLRQLQFNYSVNKPYDDATAQEFEVILGNFSKMTVQYQQMSEENERRLNVQNQLEKAKCELRDVHASLHEAQQVAKIADAKIEKERQKSEQLKSELDSSHEEIKSFQDVEQLLKREIAEQTQDIESKHQENLKLQEDVSLAHAENGVLRESLTEACDRIAELMSAELRTEAILQNLEDEVEHLRSSTQVA